MKRYQLYVKLDGKWVWVGSVTGANHSEAFRQAMASLPEGYYDKPLRFEQAEKPEPNTIKPPPPAS